MFTGLVEARGRVQTLTQTRATAANSAGIPVPSESENDAQIVIAAPFAQQLNRGDSVAVNGVCLTVTSHTDTTFTADVMPETLRVTALAELVPGASVNLERAVRTDSRLGGHIVAGHVDGVGTIISRNPGPRWDVVRISVPAQLAPLIAYKGSITVNGVSLTVSAVSPAATSTPYFEVSLIPQTLSDTNLGDLTPGSAVNLEVDVMARYLARLLEFSATHAPAATTASEEDNQ